MEAFRKELQDVLGRIAFDRPALYRNLIIYPVSGSGHSGNGIVSLHRGLKEGAIEVLDTGKVEILRMRNNSGQKVLGIDGQEVRGGYQNRVLNFSVLLQAQSDTVVNSLCVEQGRWTGSDKRFMAGGIAYPTVRTLIARQSFGGERVDLQRSVWASIQESFATLRSASATMSMADLYGSVEEDIQSLAGRISLEANQAGTAVLMGGRFFCLDVFGTPQLFSEYFPLLARSYALDSLLCCGVQAQWDFLDSLPEMLFSQAAAAALGACPDPASCRQDLVSVTGEHLHGSMLFHQQAPVHISSFMEIH